MTPLSGPAPVIVTGCFSAAAMALGPLLVFADEDLVLRQERVRRHPEIVGGGLVLVDPSGQIEQGPVTGAVKAALPVARERLRPRLEAILRRAAKVSADSDHHEILGIPRTVLVTRVFGRQLVPFPFAFGIGDLGVVLLDSLEHLRGAVDDPYRLAAPLDGHLFARRELADVGLDRRAHRLGAIRRQHGGGEGHGGRDRRSASGAGARDNERAASAVDTRVIFHGRNPCLKTLSRSSELYRKGSARPNF